MTVNLVHVGVFSHNLIWTTDECPLLCSCFAKESLLYVIALANHKRVSVVLYVKKEEPDLFVNMRTNLGCTVSPLNELAFPADRSFLSCMQFCPASLHYMSSLLPFISHTVRNVVFKDITAYITKPRNVLY